MRWTVRDHLRSPNNWQADGKPVNATRAANTSVAYMHRICGEAISRVRCHYADCQAIDMMAGVTEAACLVDHSQRIRLWNPPAVEVLGYRSEEVLGRQCYEVLRSRDCDGHPFCCRDCPVQRAAASGEELAAWELFVMTKNHGPRHLSVATVVFPTKWVVHLLHDAEGRTSVGGRALIRGAK
jgi:PAS domain-containing protein